MVNNGLKLWHERLRHINQKTLSDMASKGLLPGIKFTNKDKFQCEGCIYGKQHRQFFIQVRTI